MTRRPACSAPARARCSTAGRSGRCRWPARGSFVVEQVGGGLGARSRERRVVVLRPAGRVRDDHQPDREHNPGGNDPGGPPGANPPSLVHKGTHCRPPFIAVLDLKGRADRHARHTSVRPGGGYPREEVSPRRPENPPLDREQLAERSDRAVRAVVRGGAGRRAPGGGDDPGDGRRRGLPNARMVLLKGFGPDGFRFFTNYESAKGEELAAKPAGGSGRLLARARPSGSGQGRGRATSVQDSDAYFASRPRESRVAAAISPQSRPIERDELERRFAEIVAGGRRRSRPPRALGRLPGQARRDRVLAGAGEPDARPLPLQPPDRQ